MQCSRPIAFASKTLTNVKTSYVNIERECLSVCFGLEKFHTHLCGRHILLEKDFKPVEMIQHKPIHATPPRLQCLLLCMQKYHYTIQYKPNKDMILANCLSWFPSAKESLLIHIHQNIQHVQLSTHEHDGVWGVIKHDLVYSTLYQLTLRGWSDNLQLIPRIKWHYWGPWDELSIEASILLKGDYICIPPELLDRTLADLHGAYQGIEKMQTLTWDAVYWPGIDANIADYVKRCAICIQHKVSLPAQPILPWDIPNGLW